MSGTHIAAREAADSKIVVKPVEGHADRETFIRLPHAIYANDPLYVAPLELELKARLDSTKNPGLKNSPHRLWLAWRNGTPIGRIAAIMNKAHLDR